MDPNEMNEDKFFEEIASLAADEPAPAPASLKARLYTALVREQLKSGPLAELGESKKAGRGLCVFEELVQIAPLGKPAHRAFYCSVCHARVLAERWDHPPIWWPNCPYSDFKSG